MSFSNKRTVTVAPTTTIEGKDSTGAIRNDKTMTAADISDLMDTGSQLSLRRGPMYSPQALGYVSDLEGEFQFGNTSFEKMNQPTTYGYWNIFASGPAATVSKVVHGDVGFPTVQFNALQIFMRAKYYTEGIPSLTDDEPLVTNTQYDVESSMEVDAVSAGTIRLRPRLESIGTSFGVNPVDGNAGYIWAFNPVQYGMQLRDLGMFNLSTADLYSFNFYKDFLIGSTFSTGVASRYAGYSTPITADKTEILMDIRIEPNSINGMSSYTGPVILHIDMVHVEPAMNG